MEQLKNELLNKVHWENTFNKMILKQGFSKEDKELLWKLKEIYYGQIVNEIMSGTYKWSIPKKVAIAKAESKKKRIVYIYNIKDRYILGVMYRAISEYFKDELNDRCFSYKKGVCTNDAIRYIKYNRCEQFKFGVKMDIHSYFNSVNREKVVEMINELFDGGIKETIEKLMLNDDVEYKGNIISEWKSLIPGCAFGSFFANYCLKPCDEYFEEENVIYARYSDDIIILAESREELKKHIEKVKEFLIKYGLTMNPDKYTWFEPGDEVQYLGLKINDNGKIDISDHAKFKIKKQIHRWCRKGRMEIERDHKSFDNVAKKIIRRVNNKNMFCIINNAETFGWCHYAFRYITTIESLKEIDFYFKDTLRAMKTGKHNKANFKAISDEEFKSLGFVSLVEMYLLYKKDFDYYMEVVELLKNT